MVSSGMLRRVALVRTTRRATRRNIPEDGILHLCIFSPLDALMSQFNPVDRIMIKIQIEIIKIYVSAEVCIFMFRSDIAPPSS
jgi:hypothetical protein